MPIGIPYAEPPTADRRWLPPEKSTWPDPEDRPVYNATYFRASCWQKTQNIEDAMGRYLYNLLTKQPGVNISYMSEDCLYLNIYVPDGKLPRVDAKFQFSRLGKKFKFGPFSHLPRKCSGTASASHFKGL